MTASHNPFFSLKPKPQIDYAAKPRCFSTKSNGPRKNLNFDFLTIFFENFDVHESYLVKFKNSLVANF